MLFECLFDAEASFVCLFGLFSYLVYARCARARSLWPIYVQFIGIKMTMHYSDGPTIDASIHRAWCQYRIERMICTVILTYI